MKKSKPKNPHAVALGRNGGKARRDKLTPERRSQIAHDAVEERWRKAREAAANSPLKRKPRSRRKKAA